jgi:uncharacterized protein
MRLYSKVIPAISREVISKLMADSDIEVETMRVADAEQDMAAIMKQYISDEEAVNAATRDALERRGYDPTQFNRIKREMADVRGHRTGQDGIDYVIDQMMEFLLISRNVEEVYAEDHVMRRKIHDIFKKYLVIDEEIDREVRSRLKHLQEGTADWEVEYRKQVDQLKRIKGLI